MDIVLATKNKNKAEELKRITEGMPVSIFTLDDFPGCPETEEDGATFEANAIKKALAAARYTGRPALADDSGLEVYALGGAPGIYSARYAGAGANDRQNTGKLLSEMRSLVQDKRGARFVCCIALAFPDGNTYTFYGYAEGSIGTEQRGVRGFGYDPVFYPEGCNRTFAEMDEKEKDALSHRGKALQAFSRYLNMLINI
ncbi:MAG: XTP/dITP diphosphatase [Thermodesulfovibrionales bacterium]